MTKKKFSKKQLAAQRRFAKMAKSGKLAKLRKKSNSKSKVKKTKKSKRSTSKKIPKSEQNRLRRARNQGRSISDRKIMNKLLLAIKDPRIKEITIKK